MHKGAYLLALYVHLKEISELWKTKFWKISVINSKVIVKNKPKKRSEVWKGLFGALKSGSNINKKSICSFSNSARI